MSGAAISRPVTCVCSRPGTRFCFRADMDSWRASRTSLTSLSAYSIRYLLKSATMRDASAEAAVIDSISLRSSHAGLSSRRRTTPSSLAPTR